MEKRWGPRESGDRNGRDSHRHGIVRRDEAREEGGMRRARVKDEAKSQTKTAFSVVGFGKIEARRAKPKGGNGRVKHS